MNKHLFSAFTKSLQSINRLAISNHAEWTNFIPVVPETEENTLATCPGEECVCMITTALT